MFFVYITTLGVFALGIFLFHSTNTIYTLLNFLALVVLLSIQLILLGTEFFAILFTLIYIGVVMVMFMFTRMFINMRFESYKMRSRSELYALSGFFHIWFMIILLEAGLSDFSHLEDLTMLPAEELNRPWIDRLVSQLDVENIGMTLWCKFGFLCVIVGLTLLGVLIGCLSMIEQLKQHEKIRIESAKLQKIGEHQEMAKRSLRTTL